MTEEPNRRDSDHEAGAGTDSERLARIAREPEDLGEAVRNRAERRRRARKERERSAWFGLGMFGLVGWSVAIPTVLGIALGVWLDSRWPGEHSWTLTFLVIGVLLGCVNAWYWVKQESERD